MDEKGRYVRAPKRTIHGSKAQAYAALEQYIADYERGNDPANQTIAEYAWHFHELREGAPRLSPNSYKREMLDIRYIEEIFGDIKMKDLTPALIREREAQARKEGKHSESMLHKMHQKLRQIMEGGAGLIPCKHRCRADRRYTGVQQRLGRFHRRGELWALVAQLLR